VTIRASSFLPVSGQCVSLDIPVIERPNRTCDLCYLPRHAQLSPRPLSGHRSVWVAQVVGFLADYQLSARFAPGVVRADFKGYFGAIFNPILFGRDVVIFFGSRPRVRQWPYPASN
jgi:hypothetical protein